MPNPMSNQPRGEDKADAAFTLPSLMDPVRERAREHKALILLLTFATLTFAALLWSYLAPILWAGILAMLFQPVRDVCVRRFPNHPKLGVWVSLLGMMSCVLLPLGFITAVLAQQVHSMVEKVQSGQMHLLETARQIYESLPESFKQTFGVLGIEDFAQLQNQVINWLSEGSQLIAAQTLVVGQDTFNVLMNVLITLYLAYFFMRDGADMRSVVFRAFPLNSEQKIVLSKKFNHVVKATVRGGFAVALVQGFLGGLAFWYLDITAPVVWGVMMAMSSLIPAVGAALIWGPVAMYLYATGHTFESMALSTWGSVVIGSVDNFLRPLLVGKDVGIPDFLVLLSTLGGLPLFGIHSFVVGPLIAAMFFAVWHLYLSVVNQHFSKRPEPEDATEGSPS